MRAVNLIPLEQRSGRALGGGRSEGAAYAVLGVLAGLAITALLYGQAAHQISSRKAEIATLTARAQQAESQANALAPYAGFVSQQETRVQAVETLLDSRFDWAHAIHEVGRVLPSGTSVSSLTGTIGAAAEVVKASPSAAPSAAPGAAGSPSAAGSVSSSTPPGSVPTITLSGCATSQPTVARLLARLRLIDGVSEVQLMSSTSSAAANTPGATGGCPSHDPVYSVQVIFQALPSAAAVTAAATKPRLADATSSSTASEGAGTTSAGSTR